MTSINKTAEMLEIQQNLEFDGEHMPQDRRTKRSQKALQQALIELLSENALQDVTVNAIAEQADVNRSTFYAHYTDKYDLFGACIRGFFEQSLAERLPDAEDIQANHIKDLILVTCEFFGQMTHGCTPQDKQLDPLIETEIQGMLYEYLLHGIQTRLGDHFPSDDMVEMQAMLMSWSIIGAGHEYRHHPKKRTPEEIADTIYQLLMAPILPACLMEEPPG